MNLNLLRTVDLMLRLPLGDRSVETAAAFKSNLIYVLQPAYFCACAVSAYNSMIMACSRFLNPRKEGVCSFEGRWALCCGYAVMWITSPVAHMTGTPRVIHMTWTSHRLAHISTALITTDGTRALVYHHLTVMGMDLASELGWT
ncbi:hypothetical protein M1N91_01490 [Dehalococcoidia bacterium]|nr:hypothetical protein [Dehalococcoidia bacterium]MCL0072882.1 hypothetical protein [Dehalococcoidia bacterium]